MIFKKFRYFIVYLIISLLPLIGGFLFLPAPTTKAAPETVTFQRGVNGYTGAIDTYVYERECSRSYGTGASFYSGRSDGINYYHDPADAQHHTVESTRTITGTGTAGNVYYGYNYFCDVSGTGNCAVANRHVVHETTSTYYTYSYTIRKGTFYSQTTPSSSSYAYSDLQHCTPTTTTYYAYQVGVTADANGEYDFDVYIRHTQAHNLLSGTVQGYRESYIKFDLSSIPSNAIIESAKLSPKLYGQSGTSATDANVYGAYRITSSWIETTTWPDKPSASATSESTVNLQPATNGNWYDWLLTDMVQGWVNGSYTNYGVKIQALSPTSTNYRYFYSSNYGTVDYRPKLEITYSVPSPPPWYGAGNYTFDIYYEDPSGGSNLAGCCYNIQAGTSPTCPSDSEACPSGTWNSACGCSGLPSTTCPVTISVPGNCNVNGVGACKICSKATDTAGNVGHGEQALNIDFAAPLTTIQCNGTTCKPATDWYNANVTITLTCTDAESGCDKIYYCKDQSNTCTPIEYPYTGPVSFDLTTEGTNYVRFYSKDIAGNIEPTNSKTIKLDKTGPKSEFTDVATPPDNSTVTSDFNVSVNDWDRPLGVDNSGLNVCYYSVYDSGVGDYTKSGAIRNCNSSLSFTVTVGSGKDCRTVGGTCTVSVYAYDIAGNSGEGQFRTFNISAPCTRTNPGVSISPASQTGNPGQTLSYTVTIINYDSSDCGSSTFNLTKSCPAGWTCNLSSNSITISPNGSSGAVSLSVTSPVAATAGNYTVSVTAQNSAATSYTGTGSATYSIVCNRSNPTVTPTNSPQIGNPGDVKTFTFNITNNDTAGCGASSFNLSNTCPTGFNCSLNKTSVTINPGATDSTVTLTLTSPTTAAAGDYAASLTVTNSLDATKTATGTVTYRILCSRANPGVSISPASQTGNPGQTLSYTVTIINYDSSDCGSSIFNLTKSCPSGWTCNLSSSSITISPNGSSGAVSLSVTSPAAATAGDYTVSVTAQNSAATSYTGTGSATYSITSGAIACSIDVPNSGLVNQWFLINVSGSQGAIAEVRFASNLVGEPIGSWTNWYDWNISSGDWDTGFKTMKWSFAAAGNYEVWAELKDGAGNTRSCYDTILIMECYPGQTKTCTSAQGCSHTLTCKPDGTWPVVCPTDVCTANTQDSLLCPCPGVDGCVGNDYYDYPAYGDCNSYCSCDVGTASGQPCVPTVYLNDSRCVGVDQCDSDAECEDGNPCTTNWCENPGSANSVCRLDGPEHPNPAEGTSCGTCKQCDGDGNCVNQSPGYNDCELGCQRCIYDSCQDYNQACDGTLESCECLSDQCINCETYYDGDCGYQGICHCGPTEKPEWSCSSWQCSCICQYDAACEIAGECQRASPHVVLSPSSKSGNPGQTLTYNVSVLNYDLNCDPSTFSLTTGEYCNILGWTCTLAQNSLTIDAGQSDLTTLSVTSATGIPGGDYDVSVTATNSGAGLGIYFGTGFAKYNVFNQPPYKPTPSGGYPGGVDWDHCSYQGTSIPIFYWNYSDPEGDDQAAYEIIIENTPNWTDSGEENSPSYTIPLNRLSEWRIWMGWDTTYHWRVRVKDNQGNWSEDWSDATAFTTPSHAAPSPDFSLLKERVSQNEVVTAIDASKCYTSPGNAEVNCKDLVGTIYEWDFNYDGSFDPVKWTKGDTTWVYSVLGPHKVKLRITDDVGIEMATCYSDVEKDTVTVTLPLPKWKEIAPF